MYEQLHISHDKPLWGSPPRRSPAVSQRQIFALDTTTSTVSPSWSYSTTPGGVTLYRLGPNFEPTHEDMYMTQNAAPMTHNWQIPIHFTFNVQTSQVNHSSLARELWEHGGIHKSGIEIVGWSHQNVEPMCVDCDVNPAQGRIET